MKNYLERGEFPKYTTGKRQGAMLDSYKQVSQDLFAEDAYQATWLFERIRQFGYRGGYDTVRRYVQGIKQQQTRLACIRFETEPGRQAQMDWGEFQGEERHGRIRRLSLFVFLLGFSRAMSAELVSQCTLEAFMDDHIRAFQ